MHDFSIFLFDFFPESILHFSKQFRIRLLSIKSHLNRILIFYLFSMVKNKTHAPNKPANTFCFAIHTNLFIPCTCYDVFSFTRCFQPYFDFGYCFRWSFVKFCYSEQCCEKKLQEQKLLLYQNRRDEAHKCKKKWEKMLEFYLSIWLKYSMCLIVRAFAPFYIRFFEWTQYFTF